MREAMFWKKEKGAVKCGLCYRNCVIPEGKYGFCRVRKNEKNTLYAATYGRACAAFVDPIEKKPFYHFHPGENAFSIATAGCNFRCLHCCNPEISQSGPGVVPEMDLPPERVVSAARDYFTNIIAYTYTEPTVFYEYAHDAGVIARKQKMLNVFVTNGYAQTPVIKNAAKDFLDAARIDLKGDEEHYKRVCGNVELENVLKCIRDYYKTRMHIEIITLVIPGDNDNRAFVSRMASFIKGLGRNGKNIPWHFIRFFPSYKMMSTPATPVETLVKMRDWAKDEGMNYAYTGNMPGHEYDNTYCHNCGTLLVRRSGFGVAENFLKKDAKCPECRAKIPVVL
ncbi:MAG: AmmeMemoRadiSam system radical SAM enzyme [archaeon]